MSSLKSLVLRLPTPATRRTASLIGYCPNASFSTARQTCLTRSHDRQQIRNVPITWTLTARPYSNLVDGATKSINATGNKTANDLSSVPNSYQPPAHAHSNAAGSVTEHPLNWDSFFKLRLRRRRVQLVFSITNGVVGFVGGAMLLSTGAGEPLVKLVPLDPFLTLGLMTAACAALGWLAGPSVGGSLFYLMNRRQKPQLQLKESEFLDKVKKHRADPTNSSAANPVPDFYGEKIQSVAGYRQWLKDQRAFTRKKTKNIV